MENQTPKKIELDQIPEKGFFIFQMTITPEKIYNFFKQSMILHEKSNSKDTHKLNKSDFLSITNSIFVKNSNNNYILMNSIFELIFERLKEKKCVFKINSPFSKNNYALTDIISIEKIDIFKVQLFLSAIMLTNFKTKIETMFNIIDIDNDGLINEEELKQLILKTNKLFYQESKEKFSKSSLIQQALSNFKANKALSKLLYGNAELKKILDREKFISFNQFYERLMKIDNYMYEIIPIFFSLKKYLSEKDEEIELYMNNNCKKDFVDITYDLLCKNSMLNLVSPKNVIKQYFDKKNKTKKIKIDPLKEIKERRERQKELKLKRIFESKKRESVKTFNQFLVKNSLSATDIKYNPQTVKKIVNEKEFKYETPAMNTQDINPINKEENEKYKNTQNSRSSHSQKVNTAEYIKKFSLYSNKEEEKSDEKKPNTYPLLRATRRKTILNKMFGIPMEVSPFNLSEKNFKDKINDTTKNDKVASFSDNINLIKNKMNTTSEYNLDTNFTTLGLLSPRLSTKNNNFTNFKKVSIFKKKLDKNLPINRTHIKNGNRLIESISPTYSLINTTSRKNYSNVLPLNYINNKKKTKEKTELSDYSNFSSILFPPCIIKEKEINNNVSFSISKENIKRKSKRLKRKRLSKIDFSKSLLSTYEEIKDDVYNELELQKNSDINGLNAILRIKKSIDEKTDKFHFVDFKKNKVDFKDFFIVKAGKKNLV
jgi:hypothetical protein